MSWDSPGVWGEGLWERPLNRPRVKSSHGDPASSDRARNVVQMPHSYSGGYSKEAAAPLAPTLPNLSDGSIRSPKKKSLQNCNGVIQKRGSGGTSRRVGIVPCFSRHAVALAGAASTQIYARRFVDRVKKGRALWCGHIRRTQPRRRGALPPSVSGVWQLLRPLDLIAGDSGS